MGVSWWAEGRTYAPGVHPTNAITKASAQILHLRPLCAVAPVVDGCWDAHHHGRDEVPGDVVVLPARELALEHLDQHEVQLHTLQTHPGERSQEAEVENPGDDGAHQLTGRHMQGVTHRHKCLFFWIRLFLLLLPRARLETECGRALTHCKGPRILWKKLPMSVRQETSGYILGFHFRRAL